MPTERIDREIHDSYGRLVRSVAAVRRCHARYLDGRGDPGRDVTTLAAAHPWALGGFALPAWDAYQPDAAAVPPDGVRVGALSATGLPVSG